MKKSQKPRAVKIASATDFSHVKGIGVSARCISAVYIAHAKLSWNGTVIKSPQYLIAKIAGYGIRQVKLAIEYLKKAKYLWVKHNYRMDGGESRRTISTTTLRRIFGRIVNSNPLSAENAPLLLLNKDTGELSGGKYTIKDEIAEFLKEYDRCLA